MPSFKDIFAIQIVGLLASRQFSGDCNFFLNKLSAQFQFAAGRLIDAQYGALTKGDALKILLWACKGEIELVPKNYPENDWNHIEAIDAVIAENSPPMPDSCPFIKHLSLERGKLNPQAKSTFMMAGLSIYGNVRRSGTDIVQAQANLSKQEFWQGLFHLFGSGQVVGDYGKNLNDLLLKVQNDITANLQKMLGKRAVQLYQERLSQDLNACWPNWPKHKTYDPLYGTAPYLTWMKLLGETTAKVTSTALGDTCYKKALASLTPKEASLLQQLFD
ncbi:MAG TPA: hypothetical protein PKY50_09575 [Candidatus Competibacter sp.]|nr:hypothetical protein [Candidatus Competibacter sp.]